jgi:hypothetical protein
MDVLTDDCGSEPDFFWVTGDEEWIWDEFGFGDIVSRQFSSCLDPKSCATLDIFDWHGDGIISSVGFTLKYDGQVVYDYGGDFGYDEVFCFGLAIPVLKKKVYRLKIGILYFAKLVYFYSFLKVRREVVGILVYGKTALKLDRTFHVTRFRPTPEPYDTV